MSLATQTNLNDQMKMDMRDPSAVVWLSDLAVFVFLFWAAFAWVDEIVPVEGSMISSSRPQIIQNLEGSIPAELAVKESDIVEHGDPLARLQGTQFKSAVDDLQEQITALEVRQLRLEAELAGQFNLAVPDTIVNRTPDVVASERTLLENLLKKKLFH